MKSKKLSEEIDDLVQGRWNDVLWATCPELHPALGNIGKHVDCPFPERHRKGGGLRDFRISNDQGLPEGRAICNCCSKGMGPMELIMELRALSYTKACFLVRDHINKGSSVSVPIMTRPRPTAVAVINRETQERELKRLQQVASGMLPLDSPEAEPARLYFHNRGIPVEMGLGDIWYMPSMVYMPERGETPERKTFPCILGVFRNDQGEVTALHRIFITEDGRKAPVEKPKKVYLPQADWTKSAIKTYMGDNASRRLHITEGLEKGWAIGSFLQEDSVAAYSCSTLPKVVVSREIYDEVVIWSDNDPDNPARKNPKGDGQTYAWQLAVRLANEGFKVLFMMPRVNHDGVTKGADWEDLIVDIKNGTDKPLPLEFRMPLLQTLALKRGVLLQRKEVGNA